MLKPYVEEVLVREPELIARNIRGMNWAAEEARGIQTRQEGTMDAILNQQAIFKERWGVEPQYIDRTKPDS